MIELALQFARGRGCGDLGLPDSRPVRHSCKCLYAQCGILLGAEQRQHPHKGENGKQRPCGRLQHHASPPPLLRPEWDSMLAAARHIGAFIRVVPLASVAETNEPLVLPSRVG